MNVEDIARGVIDDDVAIVALDNGAFEHVAVVDGDGVAAVGEGAGRELLAAGLDLALGDGKVAVWGGEGGAVGGGEGGEEEDGVEELHGGGGGGLVDGDGREIEGLEGDESRL